MKERSSRCWKSLTWLKGPWKKGVTPLITPVRGGTDGARLSLYGLALSQHLCRRPRLPRQYEYIPVSSMRKAVEVILKIIELHSRA